MASHPGSSRWLLAVFFSLGVVLAPLAGWQGARWAEGSREREMRQQADNRLALYEANLKSELSLNRSLPLALSRSAEVMHLVQGRRAPAEVEAVNRHLEDLAQATGVSVLYILDHDGTTLASSNWRQADSFVGRNFAYRPYYSQVLQGGSAHYFALGSTSRVPGFYLSDAVLGPHGAEGAVVVKVVMESLEAAWAQGGDIVLVADSDDVVFITSEGEWRFGSLHPLAPQRLAEISSKQQYFGQAIHALPLRWRDAGRVMVEAGNGRSRSYVVQATPVVGEDWRLYLLTDGEPLRIAAVGGGLVAGALTLLLASAAYIFAQRIFASRDHARWQEEARRHLEAQVRQRTDQLVQAGKLAALGQMAAGIAHEINQPLAAIRAYSDNAQVFLERDRIPEARQNLTEIAGLIGRLGRIVAQLKGFARKPSVELAELPLALALRQAADLLAAKARGAGVEFLLPPVDPAFWVIAEDVRLQQVLVNVLSNAVDSMEGLEGPKRVEIVVQEEGESVSVHIRDHGTGLDEAVLPRLFDPFFTTKPAGQGLGLGLSITQAIMLTLGGAITANNHPDGGAVFTLRFQAAPDRSP